MLGSSELQEMRQPYQITQLRQLQQRLLHRLLLDLLFLDRLLLDRLLLDRLLLHEGLLLISAVGGTDVLGSIPQMKTLIKEDSYRSKNFEI